MPISVTFTDPTGRYTAQSDIMIRNVQAAWALWQAYLPAFEATLEIEFSLVTNYPNRGGGSSFASQAIGTANGITTADQGAAYEIRTGIDPNGAAPDIKIFFDVDYMTENYWINPFNGTTTPNTKSDLIQTIAHEIGHALGFNGFRSSTTGVLSGTYQSTFDSLITTVGGVSYFNGAKAMAVYGGPVPVTTGNLFHVGNSTGPGTNLLGDIMNGVSWARGAPYSISALDVAMLSDMGIPTSLSETVNGSPNSDTIYAGAGNDLVFGLAGDDKLYGEAGDDELTGGPGQDIIDGGPGSDTAVFSGASTSYSWLLNASGYTIVTDNRAGSPDGTDSLINVEFMRFTDRTVAVPAAPSAALTAAMANILRLTAPTGAALTMQTDLAAKLAAGALTQTQANSQITAQAGATTSVATLAYQFFTGKIPGLGGIDYLVSPTGPNPNNLNSPYYQSFNLENRYINFAVNLGKNGDGAASFLASYGAKSLTETVKSAYATIFGVTPTDAKVTALLAGGRDAYFDFYGRDGVNGVGTKAAAVGWLLAEAVKADIGMYAKSNDAFLMDLADGANFSVDLVGIYGKAEFSNF